MPKDKSSGSFPNKSRDLFYKPYPTPTPPRASPPKQPDNTAEWDDLTCPVCMEAPHNAVLLLCSSSDKGCRPFMCDTSYRHANCLDQYLKAHVKTQSPGGGGGGGAGGAASVVHTVRGGAADVSGHIELYKTCKGLDLVCPLCRGKVNGWKVVEKARQQLNIKRRGCAHDSCAYAGAYEQLRKHARYVHPAARPSEVDPSRQRDWWRLESQRELGDVLSTIQSAMPGATIVGDYVIEDGDEEEEERDEEPFDEHEHDEDEDEDEEQFHHHHGEIVAGAGGAGSSGGGGGAGGVGGGAGGGGGALAGVDRSLWTMLFLFRVFGGSSSRDHHHHHHHHTSSSSSSYHQSHRSRHRAHSSGGGGGGGGDSGGFYQAPLPRSSYRGTAPSRAPSPFYRRGGGGASSSSSSRAAVIDRNRTSSSSSSSGSRHRRRSHD